MTHDELEAIRARDADYNDIFEQQASMSPHIAHRLVAWPVADRRALLAEVDRLHQSVLFEQERIAAFLDERDTLRQRLAEAERERNENAVALARAAREADERYQYTCKVLAERNDATIRAELAERDAARYRWLRDTDTLSHGIAIWVMRADVEEITGMTSAECDAVIDAAMGATDSATTRENERE